MNRAYESKLFYFCRVLFGPDVQVGWDFLYHIEPAGIKSAFRRRALLTHPDHSLQRGGGDLRILTRLFIESKDACDHLLDFVKKRHGVTPPRSPAGRSSPQRRPGAERTHSAHRRRSGPYVYRGRIPSRRLLFGEFLFYSGAISWESLINAIVWQRRQRPRLGEMAASEGYARPEEIRRVVLAKKLGTPMGEAMVRAGLLGRRQVDGLVRRQRQRQRLLGEFFRNRSLLSREDLDRLAGDLLRHNARNRTRAAH